MLRKMRTNSCRMYGAEKETSARILYECLALERIRIQIVGSAKMDLGQINEARLSDIVSLEKGAGPLNRPK